MSIEISWGSLWRIILMGGFVLLLFLTREAISMILLAILLSMAADGVVDRLERWRIPRFLGTLFVFLALLSLLALVLGFIVPVAVMELRGILTSTTEITGALFDAETQSQAVKFINTNLNSITKMFQSESLFSLIKQVLGSVVFFGTVFVLGFYLTASKDGVARFLRAIFPIDLEDSVLAIYYRVKKKIENWFQAQLLLGILMSVMVYIALSALGIRYALTLACVAGMFELIPIVGPTISGALAVVIALSQSPLSGVYVLIVFVILQQLESHVLVPLIMQKAIDVHPVVILIALIGGYEIGGITGVMLAVPAAVVSQELIDKWVASKVINRENGRKIAVEQSVSLE